MRRFILLITIIPIAGCSQAFNALEKTKVTSSVALSEFGNIPNSRRAPCPVQRGVAEHNSKLDSLKAGKVIVYKSPSEECRVSESEQEQEDEQVSS